jgi:carboxyl-terminal processing protease
MDMNYYRSLFGILFVIGGSFLGGIVVEENFDIYGVHEKGEIQASSSNSSDFSNSNGGNSAEKSLEKTFLWRKKDNYEFLEKSERKEISDIVGLEKADLAYSLLQKYYNEPGDISPEKIEEWLVRGILYSTEDPYTDYFNEEQGEEFEKSMAGDFEGIGAALEKRKGQLVIEEVLKGRPAAKVGLLPGDVIIEVDDEEIGDESIWDTVLKIRGEKGTVVKLGVYREGESGMLDFEIVRDTIHVESVEFSWKGENSDIAVFEISQFGDEMIAEMIKSLEKVEERKSSGQKISGIIIDLRYNGGGYLTGAVDLASFFLPENTKVVRMEERSQEGVDFFTQKSFFSFSDTQTPLLVLVNGGSASASEIFAAAIAEHKRGKIVGEKTFGKGSVQQIFPLEKNPNEFIKITIAKWLTPQGKNFTHEEPLLPEVEIEWDYSAMTDEQKENNYDPQMEKAVEILDKKSE